MVASKVKAVPEVPDSPELGVVMVKAARGTAAVAELAVPDPALFTALNFTLYDVPFVSPAEIVNGEVVTAGLGVTQLLPLSIEYSKLVIDAPPLFAGAVKANESRLLPGVIEAIIGEPGVVTTLLLLSAAFVAVRV